MPPYLRLEERFAEIHKLEAIGTLLFWDSKVMMPAQGAASRGEPLATLTGIIRRLRRDPTVLELFETVFGLQIQIAQAEAEALSLSIYGALLDRHDPGTTTKMIDRLFGEVEAQLPEPVGVARGGSTHESQSLALEMMACRRKLLLCWMFPQLRDAVGVSGRTSTNTLRSFPATN